MKDLLLELLYGVITATVPVLAAFAVQLILRVKDKVIAQTDSTKQKQYADEIAKAIIDAVSATSQTYVDALKKAGKFDEAAQKEAAQKALTSALAAISPAAKQFIEQMYGDVIEYLTTKIEAEVRSQKLDQPLTVALPAIEQTAPDVTAIAASTAAATAATTIAQLGSTPVTEAPKAE